MKKIVLILMVFGLISPILAQESGAIKVIESEEYKHLIDKSDVQLVDVRTPKEYKEGHIEGAENIDIFSDDFLMQFEHLNKEEPVYIYCRSGNRSAKASKMLSETGFKQIIDLKGGYKAWTSEK